MTSSERFWLWVRYLGWLLFFGFFLVSVAAFFGAWMDGSEETRVYMALSAATLSMAMHLAPKREDQDEDSEGRQGHVRQ